MIYAGWWLLGGVLEPVAAIVAGVCQAGRVIRSQVVVDGFPGDATPGFAFGAILFCLEHIIGDIGEEEEGGRGVCECIITNGGQEEAKLVVSATEDDVFEGGAGVECAASYLCHCLRQSDARQTLAPLECALCYFRYSCGYVDCCQTATAVECVASYLCHCLRQLDARQIKAIQECSFSYICYSLGYADFLQAATAHECVASYLCQSLLQLDARQTPAALECALSYLGYSLGYVNLLQAATFVECTFSYFCHSFRQLDAC